MRYQLIGYVLGALLFWWLVWSGHLFWAGLYAGFVLSDIIRAIDRPRRIPPGARPL